jgi:hypothetical protein
MGGFSKLRSVLEQYTALETELLAREKDKKEMARISFRVTTVSCLFEIAGNLDTIALCARAVVEQLEKIAAKTAVSNAAE